MRLITARKAGEDVSAEGVQPLSPVLWCSAIRDGRDCYVNIYVLKNGQQTSWTPQGGGGGREWGDRFTQQTQVRMCISNQPLKQADKQKERCVRKCSELEVMYAGQLRDRAAGRG
jgi:hypothetical protein